MTKDSQVRTQIRLPSNLYDRLNDAAEEQGRSFNGEMLTRLSASFEKEVEETTYKDLASAQKIVIKMTALYLEHLANHFPESDPSTDDWVRRVREYAGFVQAGELGRAMDSMVDIRESVDPMPPALKAKISETNESIKKRLKK